MLVVLGSAVAFAVYLSLPSHGDAKGGRKLDDVSVLQNAIIATLGATTLVDKEGYTVTLGVTGGNLTATLGASASVPSTGVVLEGNAAAVNSSIGILGALAGPVRLKTSGVIVAGARVQQASDGTIVTDAGTGIVGVGELELGRRHTGFRGDFQPGDDR